MSKIEITNKTHWSTSHLRAFVREGMRRERPLFKGTMHIEVVYRRRGRRFGDSDCGGYAYYNSTVVTLKMPSETVDRINLAQVIVHELGHTVGIKHSQMTGDPVYNPVGNWRELYSWGETLPLEKMSKKKEHPTLYEKVCHAQQMLKAAHTREKRAITIRKRWESKLKRIYRQDAAGSTHMAVQGVAYGSNA